MQVGGRKAEGTAALLAAHHAPAEREPASEERLRAAHVAGGDHAPERGAAHLLLADRHRTDGVDGEAQPRAEGAQGLDRPGTPAAEVHVVPHDHVQQLEVRTEKLAHERLRLEGGEPPRESLDDGHVGAQVAEERQAVAQRLQQRRRALGGEHRHGMRMEREHDHLPARGPRLADRTLHDGAVPEMDAVEVPEREDDAPERRGYVRQVADHAHRCGPYSPGPDALKLLGSYWSSSASFWRASPASVDEG